MLASTGKSSLIALRTMVKPETLTTRAPSAGLGFEEFGLTRAIRASGARAIRAGPRRVSSHTGTP
jgi:hypothetical protein